MKSLSFFLLCLFLLAPATAARAEYLQGTVVGIDRSRGELELLLAENGQCPLEEEGDLPDQASSNQLEEQRRRIVVKATWFPRCLAAGTQVYARGQFVADQPDLFEAQDVFPCRRRGGQDPTGVRSRFHHHRRQMMHQRGGDMHE